MIYKGTVIEIYYDSIVVMAEDCTFKRIKKSDGLEEGMEIYFEDRDIIKNSNFTIKNISKGVAAVLIFAVTSLYVLGFWNENYKSVALLAVDINPSVEMEINKNYRVIKISALNEEASKLPLEDLKNYPLIDALEEIVEMVETAGYIKKDESNRVLVTSVELKSNDEGDKNLDNLIMEGKKKIQEVSNERGQQIEVVTIKSDRETLNKAKEENISVGKMEIYKEIEDENKNQNKNEIMELKDKKSEESIKEVEKSEKVKKNNNENNGNKNNPIKEEKENNKNKKGNENSKDKKDKENNKNKEKKENNKNKKENENSKDKKEKGNNKNKKDETNGKDK
ncbi:MULTISPECIES: anti-sigma factor domain-containing protein [unclassified Clostridium]|uniref:anti-sigma factor domain-containing protein n=1 Tax=unclassified Clostridium TaxID=2614128 RepID=UPI0025C4B120|nr:MULTISPECIES: anti-sigma factor domain-containing protein [unclassified Clostridium]